VPVCLAVPCVALAGIGAGLGRAWVVSGLCLLWALSVLWVGLVSATNARGSIADTHRVIDGIQ